MDHWHIAHTKRFKERHVAAQLHQRGVEVYLALVAISPANPRAAREQAFFPGYLFVRSSEPAGLPAGVRWASGCRGFVEFGGELAAVADSFVDELHQRLQQTQAIYAMAFGCRVDQTAGPIPRGPFAGYEALFNPKLPAVQRSRLLLACIQEEHWRHRRASGFRSAPPLDANA